MGGKEWGCRGRGGGSGEGAAVVSILNPLPTASSATPLHKTYGSHRISWVGGNDGARRSRGPTWGGLRGTRRCLRPPSRRPRGPARILRAEHVFKMIFGAIRPGALPHGASPKVGGAAVGYTPALRGRAALTLLRVGLVPSFVSSVVCATLGDVTVRRLA